MKWKLPQWYQEYKLLPKEKRARIRQTLLVLVVFVLLGIFGSMLYSSGIETGDMEKAISNFFEGFAE